MPKRRLLVESGDAAGTAAVVSERVFEGRAKSGEGAHLPQKKFFRQRAHINPLSSASCYQYPIGPERMAWSSHYPQAVKDGSLGTTRHVEAADVGCGFGGLTVALGPLLPASLVLGMEIRPKVTEFVRLRILALRRQQPGVYGNTSVLKINAMKYLPCFFGKGQLQKLFFCFPDPHFKPANHRRRIVNTDLLAEYAYALAPGTGRLYTITDVKDLHNWMASHADAHAAFVRLTQAELDADPCVAVMREATEEGKKVARQGGDNGKGEKYVAVFRRLSDGEAASVEAARDDFWSDPPVRYEYLPAPAQVKYKSSYGTSDKRRGGSAGGAGRVVPAPPLSSGIVSSSGGAGGHDATTWRPAQLHEPVGSGSDVMQS